jgi:hypothetical protein
VRRDLTRSLRRLIVGDLMIASQGGAIWLWILTRPFGWWPTLTMTVGPRVRIFLNAGAAAFVPSRGARRDAPAVEGVAHDYTHTVSAGRCYL